MKISRKKVRNRNRRFLKALLDRKCVGCDKIKERSSLIRLMKIHNTGEIIIMPSSRHFGRSSYLCYNKECLKNALKKKRFQKTFKKEVPASILQNLEKIINF